MQKFGRMGDEKNYRDMNAMGGNPCLEQTLESFEMCCLVETFPEKHESLEDYLTTLRSDSVSRDHVSHGPLSMQVATVMVQRLRIFRQDCVWFVAGLQKQRISF